MSYVARDTARSGISGRPILASVLAGPVLLVILAIAIIQDASPDWTFASAPLFILPVAIPIGFVIALVPNLLGTALMHALGRSNEAARLPVSWALAGALLCGGVALAFAAPPEVAGLLAATGAACALICRIDVDWS